MSVEERRERLINTINHLPEEKLIVVENLLSEINSTNSATIENIYKEAVSRYHQTLQKLAQ